MRWRSVSRTALLAAEESLLLLRTTTPSTTTQTQLPVPIPHPWVRKSWGVLHCKPGEQILDDVAVHSRTFAAPGTHTCETDAPPLVLAHGFGAGLAFFFPIFSELAGAGITTHAIDWPGMGASARSEGLGAYLSSLRRVQAKAERENDWGAAEMAAKAGEDVFVASLEEWRKAQGLDSFVLAGHSLGGLLSSAYAMAHPDRVEGLALLSPAGVTRIGMGALTVDRKGKGKGKENARRPRVHPLFALTETMFHRNITPQSIIRVAGPYGRRMIRAAVAGRFRNLDPKIQALIAEYLYQITASDGSGENVLNILLRPFTGVPPGNGHDISPEEAASRRGLIPVSPLIPRLESSGILSSLPTTILFGDSDWVGNPGTLNDVRASPLLAPSLSVVPSAGHHLYLDNPSFTSQSLISFIRSL